MALPLSPPIEPMLATAVDAVPEPDAVPGGYDYEPKWDGFRGIVYADGAEVELGSRGSKSLTRYFPELVATIAAQVREPCVLDGEIVVRTGRPGAERLDWDALSQRIHPAASRVERLSVETPASFIAFDLLAADGRSLLDEPFAVRRMRLEQLFAGIRAPLHLGRTTRDADLARRWFTEFEGAGLDGVIAKPRDEPYRPGKRILRKIKHHRTADVVPVGYRVHASGNGVGSLLVGLYDADGTLRGVGGASAFTAARRVELLDELAPLVERDANGEPVRGEGERSRFTGSKDVGFVRLRPERVLEVRYDQLEGGRFRHAVQFDRWRPDRDPASCRFDQLERPDAYDLESVLG
jgi:ATP-dependent DNA ligase